MNKPSCQRADHPDFWDTRFQSGCTPWDGGDIHAELPRFMPTLLAHLHPAHLTPPLSPRPSILPQDLASGAKAPPDVFPSAFPLSHLNILIPGCGHAFEAVYFSSLGAKVVALDFSEKAVEAARETLKNRQDWRGELIHADFFAYRPKEKFDLIYERAFLCAMPRRLWPDYAQKTASLLKPNGCLGGFFFYGEEGKGPPFAAAPETLKTLLSPFFTHEDDAAVENPLPLFPGERWQVWRFTPHRTL